MTGIIFRCVMFGAVRAVNITSDQLLDAIAAVESDRGATSSNVYQLRPIYVRDVNRITGQHVTYEQAIGDDAVARACIEAYWTYYGDRYQRITGWRADAEVLARIHNGGPDGYMKAVTKPYWSRVRANLVKSLSQDRIGGAK